MTLLSGTCKRCGGSGIVPSPMDMGTLRARRVGIGLSLRDLAKDLGISATYLFDMETGKRSTSRAMYELIDSALELKGGK